MSTGNDVEAKGTGKTIYGAGDTMMRDSVDKIRHMLVQGTPVLIPVTFQQVLNMFPVTKHDAIRKLWDSEGVDAAVVFVNDDRKSMFCGSKTVVKVGPKQTIRTLEDACGKFIGSQGLDPRTSQAKIAVFYCSKAGGTIEIRARIIQAASFPLAAKNRKPDYRNRK